MPIKSESEYIINISAKRFGQISDIATPTTHKLAIQSQRCWRRRDKAEHDLASLHWYKKPDFYPNLFVGEASTKWKGRGGNTEFKNFWFDSDFEIETKYKLQSWVYQMMCSNDQENQIPSLLSIDYVNM